MTIDIYLRKGSRKDGLSTLCVHNRKVKIKSLKIYIEEKQFKNGKISKTHPQHLRLNTLLSQKIEFYNNKILTLQLKGIEPNIATFFEETNSSELFFDKAQGFLKKYSRQIAPTTATNLRCAIDAFNTFHKKFPFSAFKEQVFHDFHDYLLTEYTSPKTHKSLKGGTMVMYVKKVNFVYNELAKKEQLPSIHAIMRNKRKDKKETIFLTKDELLHVFDSYLHNDELNQFDKNVLKTFLFACFTGLRISDIRAFDPEKHIQDNSVVMTMQKVSRQVKIPLNDYTNLLLKHGKWKNVDPSYLNRKIKAIFKKLNIKDSDKYTFHSARHTFATTCLTLNMNIKSVSKLLGHNSVITTEIYAKVVDNLLKDEMKKFKL